MPDSSQNRPKDRWNASHYTQVKVSVNPGIAAAFKSACAVTGVSMAAVLSKFMEHYALTQAAIHTVAPVKHQYNRGYETRKARRSAVKTVAGQFADILAAEESSYENVPVNLHGSKWHEASEASISVMQEVIALLDEIYP